MWKQILELYLEEAWNTNIKVSNHLSSNALKKGYLVWWTVYRN